MNILWAMALGWLALTAIGFVLTVRKINRDPEFRRKYVERDET